MKRVASAGALTVLVSFERPACSVCGAVITRDSPKDRDDALQDVVFALPTGMVDVLGIVRVDFADKRKALDLTTCGLKSFVRRVARDITEYGVKLIDVNMSLNLINSYHTVRLQ